LPASGRQRQRRKRLWVSAGWAGRCGSAGHAMNPSLGARWRHPWRQRSCQPTPPRLRQFPGDGWWVSTLVDTISRHAWMGSVRSKRGRGTRNAAFCFCSSYFFPWRAEPPESVRGRAGGAAQGREPHGCGDRAYRDVLAATPAQSHPPGQAPNPTGLSAPHPTQATRHEGLRRWLKIHVTAYTETDFSVTGIMTG